MNINEDFTNTETKYIGNKIIQGWPEILQCVGT